MDVIAASVNAPNEYATPMPKTLLRRRLGDWLANCNSVEEFEMSRALRMAICAETP